MEGNAGVVVMVSRVMDTSSPVDFAQLLAGRGPIPEPIAAELNWILNPADDAAVRMASALPARNKRSLAVHVGTATGESVLRDALAYGASEALRLELPTEVPLEAVSVVEAMAAFLQNDPPDWVVCGQATLDWGNGLVGPLLAEALGWPFLNELIQIDPESPGVAKCLRVAGKGVQEVIRIKGPAVLAVSPLAFKPMLAPVHARIKAQRATIPVLGAQLNHRLVRANEREVTLPKPRPKDSLPVDFSSLSVEQRLAMLIQANQPQARGKKRVLEGDAPTVAREIFDLIENAGCSWFNSSR